MKTLTLVVGLTLVACGTDKPQGPEMLPDLEAELDPAPDNGIQVVSPIFEPIEAGKDYEICTWTDAIMDKQTDVRWTQGFQTEPPGHHVILFYTLDKQPAGTQRVCTDTDMATFRFLAGNGGNKEKNEAPGNLVYRIPAGAQIVMNHHYLNAGDDTLRGQSAVNVKFAEAGNWIPSGNTAIVNTALEVEAGVSTQRMHCELDRQLKLWYLAPHMHRWGQEITVDVTKGGVKTRAFDVNPWDPSMTFHPPEQRQDPANPMVLNPGDSIDVACTWNNTENRTLAFGFEMCVAFGQFVDDSGMGNWACDGGHWVDF